MGECNNGRIRYYIHLLLHSPIITFPIIKSTIITFPNYYSLPLLHSTNVTLPHYYIPHFPPLLHSLIIIFTHYYIPNNGGFKNGEGNNGGM
jgi:hypothetical protein